VVQLSEALAHLLHGVPALLRRVGILAIRQVLVGLLQQLDALAQPRRRDALALQLARHLLHLLAHAGLLRAQPADVLHRVGRRSALQAAPASAGLLAATGGAVGVLLALGLELARLVFLGPDARRRLATWQRLGRVADHLARRLAAPPVAGAP